MSILNECNPHENMRNAASIVIADTTALLKILKKKSLPPHTEHVGVSNGKKHLILNKLDYPSLEDAKVYAVANGYHHIVTRNTWRIWYLKGKNEDPINIRKSLYPRNGGASSWVF